MQLFQTDRGVARRSGDELELLDVAAELPEIIRDGRVGDLAGAKTIAGMALADARFLLPVRPDRLIQVGLNYHSHLAEIGRPAPEVPMFSVTEIGETLGEPDGTVTFPNDDPDQVDHECEIALVIGAVADGVEAANAWSVIAGVTACNDISARGLQRQGFATGDFGAGKMLPGFKPLGPGLLTVDEISSRPMEISLTVNGEERQRASSDEMVFSIPELIEIITRNHRLVPGDVVMTGSPAGVGFFTGKFLRAGDVVEITLDGLPPLRTHFEKG